ncbi:hypothetical protein PVAP13_3NG047600 [Panicum virgatum]|uniref:Uncharacterized protein n=1 Tax=Panicum virgatum TaxID=38727 RepID=A0A8T0U3F4_PANVG|nr:hypothetical protein PVAP13_3NG047600 [Panicum virgatum]
MTASSLGAAASNGGGNVAGSRFRLLASFKKWKNRHLTGNCAAGAVDAKPGHEPDAVVLAAVEPSLPLNEKRGHDFNREKIWASKKLRSSNAAARQSGNAIANATAAATSSPIVRELAGNRDSGNAIYKKGHHLPWGSIGVAMDEKTEEKLRPSMFAASVHGLGGLHQDWKVTALDIALSSQRVQKPVECDHHHNGEDACLLIKRSCLAGMVVCEGSNGGVDQNRAIPSAPSTGTQEPTRRSSPTREAKGARWRGRKKALHSSRKTPTRSFMSLSSGLQCLGVTDVTPVLAKTLTATDSRLDQSRLQFAPREVMESPLMSILTPKECRSVHKLDNEDGLELGAIDRHGYSYTEGWIPEETEAAHGLLMLLNFNDEQGRKNRVQKSLSK